MIFWTPPTQSLPNRFPGPDESNNDDGCPPGQVCVVNPPNDKRVIVEIDGNNYNVHSQYAAAYQDFRNENLEQSRERFLPIAAIPNEIKNNLNGAGNHYIDIARVMVNALQDSNDNDTKAELKSQDNYIDTYGHLWLPGMKEEVQDITLKDLNFTVYPNPANDQVVIKAVPGTYELSVYNILGELVHRGTIDHSIYLNVAKWGKGIYTIELKDENNYNNKAVQKLIIQ